MLADKIALVIATVTFAWSAPVFAEDGRKIKCHNFLQNYANISKHDKTLPELFKQNIRFKRNKYITYSFEPEEMEVANGADVNISCKLDDTLNNLNIAFLRDVSEGESEHFFEAVLQALYPKTDAKQFLSDMKTKALASNNKTALEEINHVTEIYIYLEKPMSPSLDIDQTRGD